MAFQCAVCGFSSPKWMGFCPQCRSDEALERQTPPAVGTGSPQAAEVVSIAKIDDSAATRLTTGWPEFDRVLGGGLVTGGAILVGGEPGVGKSTLLLQVAHGVAACGATSLIASAEESVSQVAMRARRLGITDPNVLLTSERSVEAIIAAALELRPDLLVVDSIQTVAVEELGGAPGGVTQVRETAARLVHLAKTSGIAVVLVGHVTKDGGIAGPRLVEHAVDVVLYLEGDTDAGLRILRSLKNRFGPTHQVGLFAMGSAGLTEIADPSEVLITGWDGRAPGSVVFPTIDGRRPLMVEVQTLVAPAPGPQPRRSVKGVEVARLHQLLAVLERHAGIAFGGKDVYVSIVGGVRVREPAADLPIALAVISSVMNRPLGSLAAWGEVGLTGEVRPVGHTTGRTSEAERLGVERVLAPSSRGFHIRHALANAGLAGDS